MLSKFFPAIFKEKDEGYALPPDYKHLKVGRCTLLD